MSLVRYYLSRKVRLPKFKIAPNESEHTDKPEYPQHVPPQYQTEEFVDKKDWIVKMNRLGSYEQKVLELNMPKGYGWHCCELRDDEFQLNGLQFIKFVTRTKVIEEMPTDYYSDVSSSSKIAAERLAPHIEELIKLFYHNKTSAEEGDQNVEFISNLERLLSTCLPAPQHAKSVPTPLLNGFWLAGGVHYVGPNRPEWEALKPHEREKKEWVRNLWMDKEPPYLGDTPMDSCCSPLLTVRERTGLPPVEEREDVVTDMGDALTHVFPEEPSDDRLPPESYGYAQKFKTVKLLAGYWPGESRPNARLSFHLPHHAPFTALHYSEQDELPARHVTIEGAPSDTPENQQPSTETTPAPQLEAAKSSDSATTAIDATSTSDGGETASPKLEATMDVRHRSTDPLHQQLIISAHTQALGQAALLGFGPLTELTYPIVHQNVVTDGRTFTLSVHQANTIALHSGNTSHLNPHHNKLWVSEEMQLWDSIDPATGAVKGLNKDLIAQLAAMFQKRTKAKKDAAPYLGEQKYLWNHPARDEYKTWFHQRLRRLNYGKKWFRPRPELTAWEKIYKLDHNTMPQYNDNKKFYEGHVWRMLPEDRTLKHDRARHIRACDRPLGKRDPLKQIPVMDSEKLFDPNAYEYANWRLHRR